MDYSGQQFGYYHIIEKLGQGGMATVYKAFDTRLERDVAIKVVRKESIPPEQLERILKRFEREAKALAKFLHPNIVPVYDYGDWQGAPYLVMAYLPGGTLKSRIGKPVPIDTALTWVIPIANALNYAHQRGVIHRDVKPSNILTTEDGDLMLSDFGIARILEESTTQLTATGMGVGTPEYMAPEQWQGKATEASDQYALGVVLYELLTGRKPFSADTPLAVALKVLSEPLPRPSLYAPDLPEAMEKVLYKVLAREPDNRYESMDSLRAAFETQLRGPSKKDPEARQMIYHEKGSNLTQNLALDEDSKTQGVSPGGTDAKLRLSQTTSNGENKQEAVKLTLDSEGKTYDNFDSSPVFSTSQPKEERKHLDRLNQKLKITNPFIWIGIILAGVVVTSIVSISILWKSMSVPKVADETFQESKTAQESIDPYPQGQELANAYAGMYTGAVVTMYGSFTDHTEDLFNESIAGFEASTGIDIQYEGSKEFGANINNRLDGGEQFDIVHYYDPRLLQYAVDQGYIVDIEELIEPDWIKANYSQAWQDLAKFEGPQGEIVAGIWEVANTNSIVFYPKAKFDEAGYVVPTTWDQMMALTKQIATDGGTPWCIGIESGYATGWPMTHWIADVLLRVAPVEDYDAWVAGDLPFDSQQVNEALDYIEAIWFNDDYVYGGRANIASISTVYSHSPMFEDPPQCWFHRQGNWVTGVFPEGLVASVDYGIFFLPTISKVNGIQPEIGSAGIYAAFDDRPEVRAVMQYFSTGESKKVFVEQGGMIIPHKDADLDWYPDPVTRRVAETIVNASTFRFPGSDLMPEKVQNAFWKYITAYVSGEITRQEALERIDAAWDE